MKTYHHVLVALGAAAVGAAVALLFAPEKGEKTRKNIRDYVRDHCPFAKESDVDRIVDEIEEKIESAKEKIETSKKEVKK